MHAGDKVRFVTDTKGQSILTVEAVSPYMPMAKVDGSWNYLDRFVVVEAAPPRKPDTMAEQLKFLGM